MQYFLQQTINGVAVGCVYGLVAMGYTMAHAVVRQFNLAHGEMYAVGAFSGFLAFGILAVFGVNALIFALPLALVVAVVAAGAYGWMTFTLVYKSSLYRAGYAPLMAVVGLAIFLREYLRLVQTPDNYWMPPRIWGGIWLGGGDGFTAILLYKHVFVMAVTAAVLAGHWLFVSRTRVGRAQRACAQDPMMARLVGVDVGGTVGWTFALAAGLAAVGGVVAVVYYGVIHFYIGFVIGLKALTAAVIGGLGSLPGAMLGGLLIGVLEGYWAAYFPGQYRDVFVFGLLVAVLIFRPAGLISSPHSERIPGPGAPRTV